MKNLNISRDRIIQKTIQSSSLEIRYPVNPENPSPSATPAKSSSPVTLIWSPGNISSIAVQVPTDD